MADSTPKLRIQLSVQVWREICKELENCKSLTTQQAKISILLACDKISNGESRNYAPNKQSLAKKLGLLDDTEGLFLEERIVHGLPIPYDQIMPLMEWADSKGSKDELIAECNRRFMLGFKSASEEYAASKSEQFSNKDELNY